MALHFHVGLQVLCGNDPKTFWHRKCLSTPPTLLSTLLFTTHSPSSHHGQPEEAVEASTGSCSACPGCHSCPQLLQETCCALWCQASNNRRHSLSGAWGDPDQGIWRSTKQQGLWTHVMHISFHALHWAPLHIFLCY